MNKTQLVWFSLVFGLLLVLLLGPWFRPQPYPNFNNVQELVAWAKDHGLHYRSDWQDGRVTSGITLSTRQITWEQICLLCRAAPGQRPNWKGVIWAIDRGTLTTPPWECRVWGKILVTGDPALLDRIEFMVAVE